MAEPDPFEVAFGRNAGAKLGFVEGEFYKERVAVLYDIIYENALAGVAEVEDLFAGAVFYIEVEGDVVAIFSYQNGAPLTVAECRRCC